MVGDLLRIERDDVGEITTRDAPATVQTKVRRGKGRQATNGLLQRDESLVADVMPKQTREGPVRPGVRIRFQEHALRRGRGFVRAEAHPLDRDLAAQVVLRRDEVARAYPAFVLDHE